MLDRTNGLRFAGALSAAGLTVVTLADVWGKQEAQDITDPTWIRHAAERNYVGVTADDDLRYSPQNKAALIETGLQVFCFPNGNLLWRTQVGRILAHLPEYGTANRRRSWRLDGEAVFRLGGDCMATQPEIIVMRVAGN